MKKAIRHWKAAILIVCLLFSMTACGEAGETKKTPNTKDVAGDYYLDLSDLGMKLTVFLKLEENGKFIFSNTLDFEVNKSSGTFQKSGEEYVMVFDSVNGEEKSISEGMTGSFFVDEEGRLDFSGSDTIPYGSARISTVSEDENVKLLGILVTEDYIAPTQESEFQTGSYGTDPVERNGIFYSHMVSFYEDNTYLHFVNWEEGGVMKCFSETGTYGISTTQLALEPEGENRVECEVTDGEHVTLSLLPFGGAGERQEMTFTRTDSVGMVGTFTGKGTKKQDSSEFSAECTLYEDGSYEISADGFTETGILVLDSANSYLKQYPDHPETGERGLSQVATVPAGTFTSNGKVTFGDLRVRTSESLAREICTVTE